MRMEKKKMFEGIFVQERLLICGICGATQEGKGEPISNCDV